MQSEVFENIASLNELCVTWLYYTITSTIGDILCIGRLGTNFCEIQNEIETSSYSKIHSDITSAIWRPFDADLDVLKIWGQII